MKLWYNNKAVQEKGQEATKKSEKKFLTKEIRYGKIV